MGNAPEFVKIRRIGNCLNADPNDGKERQLRLASPSIKSNNTFSKKKLKIRFSSGRLLILLVLNNLLGMCMVGEIQE